MFYDFTRALEAIKQKTWWIWILILLPSSYTQTLSQEKNAIFLVIIFSLISLIITPLFTGFWVTKIKKTAHLEPFGDDPLNFKELYITGIKYCLFYFGLALSLALVILIIWLIPLILGKSLIAVTIVISVMIIILSVPIFLGATLIFLETQSFSILLHPQKSLNLFANNLIPFFKFIGWTFISALLIWAAAMLTGFISLISPLFLLITTAFLSYAGCMITMDLYAQLLEYLKIQIHELDCN